MLRLDSSQALTASIQRLNVERPGLEPASPSTQHVLRQPRSELPPEAENLRCSNSTRTWLLSLIVELGCRERAFFARRTTRRAYLRVGVQASLSAIGARCRRVGSPRAGVRPIQRLNSGPPAPLSQPHSVSRSCARRSQTREAEAADSARGPRGDQTARETGRGERAARRRSSSERSIPSMTAPPSHSSAGSVDQSMRVSTESAMHRRKQQISSRCRVRSRSNVEIVGRPRRWPFGSRYHLGRRLGSDRSCCDYRSSPLWSTRQVCRIVRVNTS